jgi:hypothetical protein
MEPGTGADGVAPFRSVAPPNPRTSGPRALAAWYGATIKPMIREMLARYTDKT